MKQSIVCACRRTCEQTDRFIEIDACASKWKSWEIYRDKICLFVHAKVSLVLKHSTVRLNYGLVITFYSNWEADTLKRDCSTIYYIMQSYVLETLQLWGLTNNVLSVSFLLYCCPIIFLSVWEGVRNCFVLHNNPVNSILWWL